MFDQKGKVMPVLSSMLKNIGICKGLVCLDRPLMGTPLRTFGTLGVSPWLIQPCVVKESYTHLPPSCIVTLMPEAKTYMEAKIEGGNARCIT